MSRRFALVAALVAALLMPGVATATSATITLSGNVHAFSSGSPKVSLGEDVQWQTFSTTVAHTTTSDKFGGTAFGWNISLPQGSNTYGPVNLSSAGGFAYHCTIHPSMRGTIMVQMSVTNNAPSVGQQVTITFALSAPPSGFSETIQKRKAGGTWKNFSVGNTGTTVNFTPPRARTFEFRARLVQGGVLSNWSPTLTVTAH